MFVYMTPPARFSVRRIAPLLAIALAATLGFIYRDAFSFQTLADNREQLLAWRDSSYVLAAAGYSETQLKQMFATAPKIGESGRLLVSLPLCIYRSALWPLFVCLSICQPVL